MHLPFSVILSAVEGSPEVVPACLPAVDLPAGGFDFLLRVKKGSLVHLQEILRLRSFLAALRMTKWREAFFFLASMPHLHRLCPSLLALALTAVGIGRVTAVAPGDDWRALLATGQLVDIQKFDPSIAVDLRYAGTHNLLGRAFYEPDMPCMMRLQVARYLHFAQDLLRPQGYGLKVWDAYRPPAAQRAIWQSFSRPGYVANPNDGRGSLHSWGLAVDVTLVDREGHELAMPSAFDDFTGAASGIYRGSDESVHARLRTLQTAMKAAGFIALSTEWWHFAARNWKTYEPLHWQPTTEHDHPRP